jgi:hypothetical protein
MIVLFVASSNEVGGVGKTMLTSAVIRDARIRNAFQLIAWLNMSQKPDLLQLQQTLYAQLSGSKMPSKAHDSVELQLRELRLVCAERVVLITLDGALY